MKDLEKIKPREKVGSATFNKFKFQIAVAIELLLKLAKQNKDFWLLMDYLEDVVIIEDFDKDVSIISFYQVKSKERGVITISNVISEQFLNKMHYNISSFRDHQCNAYLITNCGISFNGSIIKGTEKVNLGEYLDRVIATGNLEKDKKENTFRANKKKEIIKSIAKTEGVKEEDVDLKKFFLLTTTLTLNDYDRQINGSFMECMNNLHPTLTVESINTIKEKIWRDLEKKNAFVVEENNIDESYIVKNKGITKKRFDEIVKTQKYLQFPTFEDLLKFCSQYGSNFGKRPIRDKERYEKFQVECILEEKVTQTLIFEILNNSEDLFIDKEKNDLIDTINDIIQQDSRVTKLDIYKKYKDLFQIMYLYKKLEG